MPQVNVLAASANALSVGNIHCNAPNKVEPRRKDYAAVDRSCIDRSERGLVAELWVRQCYERKVDIRMRGAAKDRASERLNVDGRALLKDQTTKELEKIQMNAKHRLSLAIGKKITKAYAHTRQDGGLAVAQEL